MPYSIPSSTKIITLATAPFLFILVGALSVYEFAIVPAVNMAQMYTFNNTVIKNI